MKKILPNNAVTKRFICTLPKIYMIALWAGYGVVEFSYAGKCDKDGVPYVYNYVDCNGSCDEYHLVKLTSTTTGWIYAWTTSENKAKELARYANIAMGEGWRESSESHSLFNDIKTGLQQAIKHEEMRKNKME